MSDHLLTVKGLSAFYGPFQVLHDVDFRLRKGEITTLLGANGAGKTSTLRALSQMIRTEGSIQFEGEPMDGSSPESVARRGIAHVPDGRGTFAGLSVDENLRLGAYIRRDRAAVAEDMEKMYGYFPRLKERRAQQAGTLSGGEQQMLAISRALMLRPKLLLMDEPSFGLAPMVVREIFELIRRINRTEKTTILLVEQNAALTLEFATHAYLMETGRIVLAGRAEDIKQDDNVRKAYLGY
ncbi:ABC transporter ATP-binding protein [Rhodoferax koreense]|uniref:ABC transporter ATP-binding protein n=1 Tax=Rhodoferax koreensis TaxID=1842727 RepID=A0A1P8K176_9BURK|nr:ABC transporter ATP-binding protein [Rhodoferax koreense]APW39745.1 ABC transporter ATP-binding protein [Rhodoferax koreense]